MLGHRLFLRELTAPRGGINMGSFHGPITGCVAEERKYGMEKRAGRPQGPEGTPSSSQTQRSGAGSRWEVM
jgi:hypothetical protein